MLDINPRPQLKLVSVNLSGEKTNPLALEIPGFPLDAPSKKIATEEELNHQALNEAALQHTRQEGELPGLMQTEFLIPNGQGANQAKNSKDREEGTINLHTISEIIFLILNTIS